MLYTRTQLQTISPSHASLVVLGVDLATSQAAKVLDDMLLEICNENDVLSTAASLLYLDEFLPPTKRRLEKSYQLEKGIVKEAAAVTQSLESNLGVRQRTKRLVGSQDTLASEIAQSKAASREGTPINTANVTTARKLSAFAEFRATASSEAAEACAEHGYMGLETTENFHLGDFTLQAFARVELDELILDAIEQGIENSSLDGREYFHSREATGHTGTSI